MVRFKDLLKSFIAAPAVLLLGFLVSLPVYYLALTVENGEYAFYIENAFVVFFGLLGFFGLKWIGKPFGDYSTGDVFLFAVIWLAIIILRLFSENPIYAVGAARYFYPGGLHYKSMLTFENGFTMEALKDLMKFSSIYYITYAASMLLVFMMFCRTKWNQSVPGYIATVRSWFDESQEMPEEAAHTAKGDRSHEELEGIQRNTEELEWDEEESEEEPHFSYIDFKAKMIFVNTVNRIRRWLKRTGEWVKK